MVLLACGLNHKTASIALRERVAFHADELTESLHHLLQATSSTEGIILSTCNRTELYCNTEQMHSVIDWFAYKHGLDLQELKPHLYVHQDYSAMRHLLRVACGLDSMMLGETQVVGQIKTAFDTARKAGTIGYQFKQLFPYIFASSKKVRSETGLSAHPMTLASVIHALMNRIFSQVNDISCLLIGAGETIELIAKAFYSRGLKNLVIANRNEAQACHLAQQVEGQGIGLTDMLTHLPRADVVIAATASPVPILGKGSLERAIKLRKHRPMLLIDLAVPRDIEPEVSALEDIFLYNIDDLQKMIEKNQEQREHAARHAETLIDLYAENFLKEQQAQAADSLICAFRTRLLNQCDLELKDAKQALAQGVSPTEVLERFAHRLCNKFLHEPTVRMRKFAYESEKEKLLVIQQLLGLEPTEL